MSGLLDSLPEEARGKLKPQRQPEWTAPMLATLTDDRFSDRAWVFERKLDGERALAFRRGKTVRLLSRNQQKLNAAYPEVVDALEAQDRDDFIVDGEIVAFEGNRTSFSRLQGRMQVRDAEEARRSGIAVFYYVFDLLHVDGHDVSGLGLRDRKSLLRRALSFRDPLRFTTHRNEYGERYYREACRKGWEGLIAKRADAPYRHSRSRDWLKFKCVNEQELVVGGYTDPKGSRAHFGALLVGYYRDGELAYAGKVGTGFDERTLADLGARLERLERESPPFAENDLPSRGVHWVRPELVVQVGFTEWTGDGKLRHPRYLGLRRDKQAKDVVRERP